MKTKLRVVSYSQSDNIYGRPLDEKVLTTCDEIIFRNSFGSTKRRSDLNAYKDVAAIILKDGKKDVKLESKSKIEDNAFCKRKTN